MGQLSLLDSAQPTTATGKSDSAYKTISEVSEILGVPQHVLRFWEHSFPQLAPSRMRGSRRYYRPEDLLVLENIKTLLYTKGYTIKGARKLLKSKDVIIDDIPATSESVPAHETFPSLDVPLLINELNVLKSMLKTLL